MCPPCPPPAEKKDNFASVVSEWTLTNSQRIQVISRLQKLLLERITKILTRAITDDATTVPDDIAYLTKGSPTANVIDGDPFGKDECLCVAQQTLWHERTEKLA